MPAGPASAGAPDGVSWHGERVTRTSAEVRSIRAARRIRPPFLPGAVAIGVLVLGTVAACGSPSAHRARSGATPTTGDPPTVGLADIEAGPRIVFRDNARAHFGVLAMAALRDPSGPRAVTTTRCARSYAAMHRGTAETLCLSLNPHTIEYQTDVLDDQRRPVQSLPLEGIPSRARLSRDGTLAATTAFTAAGDSYVTKNFTARTYITTVGRPHSSVDLERFRLTVDGRRVAPIDRNYWGVTFSADDNRFYATVAFGGRTWLVRGDLHARTVTTVHENVECPSLSPDGRTLVYKKRYDANRQHWRLTAVDLRSQRETPLAETRSIDDQVEWLDDAHVMYEVPRSGTDAGRSDVWTVPADGTGHATLLIPLASSPAVVR